MRAAPRPAAALVTTGVTLAITIVLAFSVLTARAAGAILDQDDFDSLSSARWTVTDSQNRLSANGRLLGTGTSSPTWNDPGLVGKTTYARVPGRAIIANVLHRDVAGAGPLIGWTSLPQLVDPRLATHALSAAQRVLWAAHGPAGIIRLGTDFDGVNNFLKTLANTEYIYTVVLRPTGAFYFVSTGPGGTHATFPSATLVWVDSSQTATGLAPFISHFSSDFTIDDVRVV